MATHLFSDGSVLDTDNTNLTLPDHSVLPGIDSQLQDSGDVLYAEGVILVGDYSKIIFPDGHEATNTGEDGGAVAAHGGGAKKDSTMMIVAALGLLWFLFGRRR